MRYFLSKVGYALLTLFGVITLIFFLLNVLSGDPAQMMLDQNEDSEQLAAIKNKFGFDLPVGQQYIYFLNNISPISFHSNNSEDFTYIHYGKYNYLKIFETETITAAFKIPYLGESFQKEGKTVLSIISETLPNTFILALSSITIAVLLGLILGILSALYKNSFIDQFLAIFTAIGMSLPSFFSSIIIAWIFAFLWREYTGLNMTGSLYEVDDYGNGTYISLKNLILPSIALGIRPIAIVTQLMRNSLLNVLNQDYIQTAKAKGLSSFYIIRKHALKNALNPVLTAVSGWFASMLAGSVFIEYIFGWNGLGKQIVEALNYLDYPIVIGAVIVIAVFFILINSIVDLLYTLLDPRVKIRNS